MNFDKSALTDHKTFANRLELLTDITRSQHETAMRKRCNKALAQIAQEDQGPRKYWHLILPAMKYTGNQCIEMYSIIVPIIAGIKSLNDYNVYQMIDAYNSLHREGSDPYDLLFYEDEELIFHPDSDDEESEFLDPEDARDRVYEMLYDEAVGIFGEIFDFYSETEWMKDFDTQTWFEDPDHHFAIACKELVKNYRQIADTL